MSKADKILTNMIERCAQNDVWWRSVFILLAVCLYTRNCAYRHALSISSSYRPFVMDKVLNFLKRLCWLKLWSSLLSAA